MTPAAVKRSRCRCHGAPMAMPSAFASLLRAIIRSAFEADQEDHLALLLGNSREGAIEIAQREPPCRIGCCYRGWPIIVNLARGAFAHIAPDTVYVQVMHKREEAGAEIGTALQRCCFAIARTRVSWTRSSARDTSWV